MTVKKPGLGRGLEALFNDVQINIDHGSSMQTPSGNEILFININDIKPNSNQPRKSFSDERIEELAQSIKVHGVIQPIMVQKADKGYEIIAGERRWRAAHKAQVKELPCIIRQLDERENMLVAIIENMQREDLNAIEEAMAFDQMTKKFDLTQEEISKSVGKSRPYITNTLRLLKLDPKVQTYIIEGRMSGGHARALLAIRDHKRQMAVAEDIVEKGLSVRQVEAMATETVRSRVRKSAKKPADSELTSIEDELKAVLGTKVVILPGKRRGKIEIEYYSKDELERLIELLASLKNH